MAKPQNDWRNQAACRGEPYELFFPVPDKYGVDRDDPALVGRAKAVCQACPVREECLDEALDGGPDMWGVWGGTTRAERACLRRRIPRAKCPVCASTALCGDPAEQVCCGCGHSWSTARPGQIRANADAAV